MLLFIHNLKKLIFCPIIPKGIKWISFRSGIFTECRAMTKYEKPCPAIFEKLSAKFYGAFRRYRTWGGKEVSNQKWFFCFSAVHVGTSYRCITNNYNFSEAGAIVTSHTYGWKAIFLLILLFLRRLNWFLRSEISPEYRLTTEYKKSWFAFFNQFSARPYATFRSYRT